jgi:hypothetical protein
VLDDALDLDGSRESRVQVLGQPEREVVTDLIPHVVSPSGRTRADSSFRVIPSVCAIDRDASEDDELKRRSRPPLGDGSSAGL